MSANGIAQLPTREERQKAKLDLAAAKRATDGNARATYDLTQLPTQYDNNSVVDNPNTGGLVVGRPWITTAAAFTFYEAFGTTTAISTTQYVSGNKIYAESSTYDVPSYQPARVVVNDIEIVNTEERGHTLVILDSYGNTVSITNYDTFETVPGSGDGGAPARLALQSALAGVDTGNIVILVVYDASSVDASVRSAINTGYESTNSNTWTADRKSHILIGEKVEVTTISLRSFLSGSGQTAYDAASSGAWFAVSSTDWDAAVAGVTGATKKLVTDGQMGEASGAAFSSNYIITQAQAAATIDAGNYIFALKGNTSVASQTWTIYGGTSYKSLSYAPVGSATPSTGAGGTGTFYYLRKAPTALASTTYIGIVGSQNLTMTSTSLFPGSAYLASPYNTGSWGNWNGVQPKVQVVTTTSAVV